MLRFLLPFLYRRRFLNVEHGPVSRFAIGGAGFVFTLLATRELILAREVFARVYRHNAVKLAVRRLSWYGRRSWIGLRISDDLIFVFCHDLTLPQLAAQRRFLTRRRAALDPARYHGDMAYISALQMMATLDDPAAYLTHRDGFYGDANAFLTAQTTVRYQSQARGAKDRPRERFSEDDAGVALREMLKALAEAGGAQPFVVSGTFLGLERDGGFLPHDYDIDIGVMAEETRVEAVEAALTAQGVFQAGPCEYQIVLEYEARDSADDGAGGGAPDVPHAVSYPAMIKATHPNGVQIDIFFHHRAGDTVWHGSALFRWDNSAFDLVHRTLAGTPVLAPGDADRYLCENYGDWRTPIVDFHSALDTPNHALVRNPLSVAIFLKRIWMARTDRPADVTALLDRLTDMSVLVGVRPDAQTEIQTDIQTSGAGQKLSHRLF